MEKLATRLITFLYFGSGESRYSISKIDGEHEQITGDVKIKLRCNKKTNTQCRHKRFNVKLLQDTNTKKKIGNALR